ncbi:MAG: hypothetical protein E7479_03350 [Ruminococcaceae bacterium]|nr:hypothetical protein [Oscillospiraceae bacterium]
MYKEIKCIQCGKTLDYIKSADIQLGKDTGIFSDSGQWGAGTLYCDIYICPECGEYHFIKGEKKPEGELVKCKWCCKKVDASYPKCTNCGRSFDEKW